MSSDIERFLRQAAQRRAQQNAPRPPQTRPPQAPAPPRPVAQSLPPQPRRLSQTPDVIVLGPEEIEIIEAEPVAQEGVAQHVASHLDTSEFKARSAQLGEVAGQADERLESRLHSTFDHDVATIKGSSLVPASEPTAPTQAPRSLAEEVMAMFQNPRNMRQAVLMREVFDRPEHRW